MEINYVTGNIAKINSAKEFLEPHGIKVNQIKMDTPEIQSDNVDEIASYSARFASEKLKMNVLKNDTGFFVETLNGFPGVYAHYVEDTIGSDGLLKLLDGSSNRRAKFVEAFAYCEYGTDPVIFKSITTGTISKEKSGKYGWGWDFIFIPDGEDKTLASFSDSERYSKWSNDAFYQIIDYLSNREK